MAGIDTSKMQPWPEWNPQPFQDTGQNQNNQTGGSDLYSADWLKNLAAVYAKPWGGQQGSEQAWYRTPEWGGGILWNPYWGFQSGKTVKPLYSGGQLGTEDFYGMGLTRNPGEDWKQYYNQLTGFDPENPPTAQTGAAGGGGMAATGFNPQQFNMDFSYVPGYGEAQPFQYPDELNWATDYLGEYAATGRPTSWSPWYQQAKGTVQTDVMDAIKQAAEQAGLGGTRWSTPMGRTAQDIASRAWQNLGTQFMGLETGALESAAGRGLQAAGMLPALAQQRQQMPMDLATGMYNLGSGMTGAYNQMMSPLYNEWMRTQAYNNPWLQYGMGLQSIGGMMPQQYQQSFMGQFMGMLPYIIPFLSSGGGSGYMPLPPSRNYSNIQSQYLYPQNPYYGG